MDSSAQAASLVGEGAAIARHPAPPRAATIAFGGLLDGPIVPPLLRLALPMIVVLVVQTFVGVAETYFVGHLGTEALAGVSLVFPVLMLMAMMSNGGIGGGVASAVARALGGGRARDADALVLHAVVLALLFGAAFTTGVLGGGAALYGALGGTGEALVAAQQYSSFVFGGAVLAWVVNLLAAALRGAGNVKVPALVILAGAVLVVPLSPALIFGFGPIPRLGIAGAGAAIVIYYALAAVALVAYMRSARSPVRLARSRLQWRLFKDILGVGGLSAVGTVQANLTVAIITGLAGAFGTDALAGYGMASRLDYVLIPLLFGLGTATVTMVGANIGAGNVERARRIAWSAALLAAGVTEAIGVLAALFPQAWVGIFSADEHVLAVGALYLRVVAPFYGLVGLGMMLYFAGQGAKRVALPVLAGSARLAIAGAGGWLAVAAFGASLPTLFAVVAASSIAFGGMVALATALRPWGLERRSRN
ncbi:MAG: MATE family efflux transporter [Proteobacteria bacterium]|nr:MATE family efflux transporter [Pseudomonadota bacterium]